MTADDAGDQQDQGSDRGHAGNSGQGEKTFTQAQLTAILERKTREIESRYEGFDDIKAKADEYDKLNDSVKSEVQRATEAAQAIAGERDSFKSENEKLQTLLRRQKISATEGLDPDLWDRVIGDTEEEIAADVKRLVEKFSAPSKRSGAFRSGASAPDGATTKQRAAAALRGVRRD